MTQRLFVDRKSALLPIMLTIRAVFSSGEVVPEVSADLCEKKNRKFIVRRRWQGLKGTACACVSEEPRYVRQQRHFAWTLLRACVRCSNRTLWRPHHWRTNGVCSFVHGGSDSAGVFIAFLPRTENQQCGEGQFGHGSLFVLHHHSVRVFDQVTRHLRFRKFGRGA